MDQRFMGGVFKHFDFLRISSVDDARALVGTVATSMLALAGVSFSSIMVTMTLASQQFGPRILRNFLKDTTSQTTLGVLIGTFVYCLFLIRAIRSHDDANFVPQFSTLVVMVLAIVCLAVFIRFIHHILNEIQAESVIADAYHGLEETIDNVFPAPGSTETEHPDLPENDGGWDVIANKSGYIQAISHSSLAKTAGKYDVLLTSSLVAGDFISDQQPIVRVVKGPPMAKIEIGFIEKIQDAFLVGKVRTPEQDFEYGFRQLVEIALRALSPGINDPFTAMDSLDYLGASLQSAFSRPLPCSAHRDEDNNLRFIGRASSYPALVEAAFNQIRQAAVDRCDVCCRILEVIEATARVSDREDQQEALLKQATLVNQNTLPQMLNEHDCQAIAGRFQAVLRACDLTTPFS
jgi:uncharacterized membrane protein